MPKLSVITPVFNCEKYLRESIDSILNQTFTDFEFIIVNDGSTDGTKDIIKSYNDNRIIFIDNIDNKKIPFRRNQAIDIARGECIVIHDGDDISLSDRLEKEYSIISNSNTFCVGGHAVQIDMNGEIIGKMDYPPETHEDIMTMITKKCTNPMIDSTTMFRKDIFVYLGKYTLDETIYTVPDFDLWLKAISSGYKFCNITSDVIKYRTNPNGMTQIHKNEMIQAHMVVWRKFMTHYWRRIKKEKKCQNKKKMI